MFYFQFGFAQFDMFQVTVNVVEMDEQTQTLEVIIEGADIDLEQVTTVINEMGGSLHSVDSVQVIHVTKH